MASRTTTRVRMFAATAALVCTVTGACTSVSGDPSAAAPSRTYKQVEVGPRQTDDAGRKLPFENRFPNRWSINNDGTSYEPCTQVPAEVVRDFGLDPGSVRDAAASDFQTARGCEWTLLEDGRSSLSQYVGNILRPEDGLEGHKARNSVGSTWLPDTEISGRTVLVESMGSGECAVYVRSGDAVVITSLTIFGFNPPPIEQVCGTATDFLRATISQIPL